LSVSQNADDGTVFFEFGDVDIDGFSLVFWQIFEGIW
jgi:hypothetical protein